MFQFISTDIAQNFAVSYLLDQFGLHPLLFSFQLFTQFAYFGIFCVLFLIKCHAFWLIYRDALLLLEQIASLKTSLKGFLPEKSM